MERVVLHVRSSFCRIPIVTIRRAPAMQTLETISLDSFRVGKG